jgi:DNA-binding transcriptional LysR family regulator
MANQDPSWDLYRSFLAVLRTGSLSAAARSLQLTQPTVGRHITRLQELLGERVLFTRSPGGLLATAAAQELRVHAEAMESAAAALRRSASSDAAEQRGTVRIAAADVMGVEVLPRLLTEFRLNHPTTTIELSLSNQVVDLLRRDADIAVRMAPPKQQSLIAKKVGDIVLGLYAHRRYLERFGQPQTMDDLTRHALIGYDRLLPFDRILKGLPLPLNREMFEFRSDNDLAQLAAIRQGFGVGMCHHGLGQQDPNLVCLFPKQIRITLQVWVCLHVDLKRSPKIRAMFDHLVKGLTTYIGSVQRV